MTENQGIEWWAEYDSPRAILWDLALNGRRTKAFRIIVNNPEHCWEIGIDMVTHFFEESKRAGSLVDPEVVSVARALRYQWDHCLTLNAGTNTAIADVSKNDETPPELETSPEVVLSTN